MPSSETPLPELRVEPNPVSPQAFVDLRGDGPRLALIFAGEAELFQSTVHQLQLDADAAARVGSSDTAAVLGVRADWRTDDHRYARRALLVDTDGLVSQVSFECPVPMDVAWIMHLPLQSERELHASISRECGRASLLPINPYPASERADDKTRSHELWTAHLERGGQEFALPAAVTVPRGASAAEAAAGITRFVERLGLPTTIIAQPNCGTEGRDAMGAHLERTDIDSLGPEHPLVRHVCDAIVSGDDALIREERGNVRVTGLRRIAFRFNVAWNGAEFVAESGFAQVAPTPDAVIASRGQEGAIADLGDCLANLYYEARDGWRRFVPSEDDIAALKRTASAAARALNADLREDDYLKHMGIDVVVEVDPDSGKMTPVLLEANARPAGLNQSTALRGIAPGPSRLHITKALFDFIHRRLRAGPAGA